MKNEEIGEILNTLGLLVPKVFQRTCARHLFLHYSGCLGNSGIRAAAAPVYAILPDLLLQTTF